MKTLLLIPLLFCGCAVMRTTEVSPDGSRKTTTVYATFSKSAMNGFASHKTTKTTSSQLSIHDVQNETQSEALEALIRGAVEGALKAAK